MRTQTLNTAELIYRDLTDKEMSISALSRKYSLSRPHIKNHILFWTMPESLKKHFIDGYMSFIPLLQLYKKHGEKCNKAIEICKETQSSNKDNDVKKIPLSEVEFLLSGKPRPSTKTEPLQKDVNTVLGQESLDLIVALRDQVALASAKPAIQGQVTMSVTELTEMYASIEALIGKTLSASNATLVLPPLPEIPEQTQSLYEMDQTSFFDPEDENQDLYRSF